jgi:hypothetical protein
MKKVALIITLLIAFCSCTQEVTFNNPSVQGMKDNFLWRAKSSNVVSDVVNNTLTITAINQLETLTFKVQRPNRIVTKNTPITYALGVDYINTVNFNYRLNGTTLNYITGTNVGDGQVIITEYDPSINTLTGTFRFNSKNSTNSPLGNDIINFNLGVFYKIPILN